mgnify:CR=1 FL=1
MSTRTPEQFYTLIQEIRGVLANPAKTRCSCPKTACEWHGRCRECVAIHRHFRDHVPNCMQDFMKEKIAAVAGLVEMEVVDKPRTPKEHWDYVRQRDREAGASPDQRTT